MQREPEGRPVKMDFQSNRPTGPFTQQKGTNAEEPMSKYIPVKKEPPKPEIPVKPAEPPK